MNTSIINLIFTGLLLLGALVLWQRAAVIRKKINWEESVVSTLLCVSVPKNNDRTPQAAEQMFAALHGIFRTNASDQLHISFEIVARNNSINFYVFVPTELRDFVSSQIFSQYPTVEIREIVPDEDYTHIKEGKSIVAGKRLPKHIPLGIATTELELKKPTAYPIKTFQSFEVDPLSSITGAISSMTESEEVWLQVLIRPVDDDWQDLGKSEIKKIKEPFKPSSLWQLAKSEFKTMALELGKQSVLGPPAEEKKKDEKKKDDKDTPESAAIKAIEEKITKLGFATNIRILAAASDDYSARAKIEQIIGAFKQFNTLNLNSFVAKNISSDFEAHQLFTTRTFGESSMIFNITELASIYHYPSLTVATPTIAWAGSKKGEPPANLPIMGEVPADELTVFAQTNFRSQVKKFGIKKKDRRLHTYIIGKTGTGKSTLMENMIIDDINEGRGMAVVDPHGSLIAHVLEFIPENRLHDVIYFNPADRDFPIGFNLLENVNPEQKNIVASGVVGILEKIFGEVSWGPRLEYILRNVILALLEYPNSTFMGIMRLLTDNAYRRMVLNEVKDPVIRDFFLNEYEKYEPKFRTEAIAPIQNKVGQFLSASTIRNIIGQPKSTVDIRSVMDEGKILLADLSIGKIGEDNSALLGSMLITKIQLAAMGRVDVEEDQRRDFYLYVDEFQNFATESFATILSEARKYRLNLAMANQYTAQMPENVANAVFGNVGTMISFRVGAQDANVLVKEFEPVFDANDLVNLDNYQIYLKMAIDGVTVPAFSAGTLPPKVEKTNLVDQIIANSRLVYTRPVEEVEDYITEWSSPINLSDPSNSSGQSPRTSPQQTSLTQNPKVGESETKNRESPITNLKVGVENQEEGIISEDTSVRSESVRGEIPEDLKIEIIKDRFDRPWYAVEEEVRKHESRIMNHESKSELQQEYSPPTQQSGGVPEKKYESQPASTQLAEEVSDTTNSSQVISAETDTPIVQSGGGGVEKNQLISWDDIEQLGITAPTGAENEPVKSDFDQDLTPLDEIS